VSVFTSDTFLAAFSAVINATPVYGKGLWIRHGRFVNKAEGSAWNLFAKNPNVEDLIRVAKDNRCWFLRFVAAAELEDSRLPPAVPSPTLLTFPDFKRSKDLRWSIRKAEKEGFTVDTCKAADIQSILEQLWARLGRAIPLRFYQTLENAGIGKALVSRLGDRPCSGLFYLVDEDNVWYMYSLATDAAFKSTQVTSLLVDTFIRSAFENGAPYVDLCGSSVPSIRAFKKQFATKEHIRPLYEIPLNSLYPLGKSAMGILSGLRMRLHEAWRK